MRSAEVLPDLDISGMGDAMRTEPAPDNQWYRLVTELQGSRDEQQDLLDENEWVALASDGLRKFDSSQQSTPWVHKWLYLAAAACLLMAIGLGWAVMAELNSLKTRVVALQSGREESRERSPIASTSAEAQSLQTRPGKLTAPVAEYMSHQPPMEARGVRGSMQQAPRAHVSGERAATAVRECSQIVRRVPRVTYRPVAQEVAVAGGGTETVYRTVCETAERSEITTLPRDVSDNPPMLPSEELLPALTHGTDLVRWAAADALSRTGTGQPQTNARAIREALKKRDDLGRAAADYVLTGHVSEGFGSDLSKPALEALASPDKIIRWAGLHYFLVVRRCFEDKKAAPASPTFFEPNFVARLMGRLVAIARQKDEDALLRKAAVYLLGQFGDGAKPAIGDLIQLVESDPDPQVRRWAAYAIGQIGAEAKAAVPQLGRILLARATNRDGKAYE